MNQPDQTISSLSKMVDADIVKDSNLIELKVYNNDPVKAYELANSISEQYLELMNELMFSSVVVISPANVPATPVKPNKNMNIASALVLGFILSILLAFLLEHLDNTLKTPDDVNRKLNLPVLGLIPMKTAQNTKQSM